MIKQLKKKIQIVQSYDYRYTISFKKENSLSPLWELNSPLLIKNNVFPSHTLLQTSLVEIGPVVLQKTYFCISSMVFFFLLFPYNLLEFHSPKNALCQSWPNLVQWFWSKRFYISSMNFCYFIIISPWKVWVLLLNKLEFPSPKDASMGQFSWNWSCCCWEKHF